MSRGEELVQTLKGCVGSVVESVEWDGYESGLIEVRTGTHVVRACVSHVEVEALESLNRTRAGRPLKRPSNA